MVAVILDEASRGGSRFDRDAQDALPLSRSSTHEDLGALEIRSEPGSALSEGAADPSTEHITTDNEEISLDSLHLGTVHGQIAKLSISHDGDYAIAMCIASEEPVGGDVGGEAHARELL